MSVLFLQPDDILIYILSEMCPVKDVLKLDTVFCNGQFRGQILKLFNHKCFALSDIQCNENVQNWIYGKKIKFRTLRHNALNFDRSQVDTSLVEQLNYFSPHIREDRPNEFIEIVNQCLRLKRLTYEGYDSIANVKRSQTLTTKLDRNILRNLTSVDFNCNQMIAWLLAQFATHCNQLKQVMLFSVSKEIGVHLDKILRNNKDLDILTVYTTFENHHIYNLNNLIHSLNGCSLSRLIRVCLEGKHQESYMNFFCSFQDN